jgi:TrfA protein
MATKRTFEENLALTKARAKAGEVKKEPAVKAKQLSLELWPEAVRGAPNTTLRSALFGISTSRKTLKKRTLIKSVEGVDMRFKGETFNQTDFDVWAMLLHLGRMQPLGTRVEFTAHAFLKELGRATGKTQHEQLKEEFARLVSGYVELTWTKEKKTFAGSLVSKLFRDEETGRYVVILDKDIMQLFASGWTMLDWDSRLALGKNSVAKWLQNWYSSHAKPYPMKVETYHALIQSTEVLRRFRFRLRAALDELVRVGTLKSWTIENDLVHVVVMPSKSQQKHLAKAKKR